MKSIDREKSPFARTIMISHAADYFHFDGLKERVMIALAWSAGVAVIVALYTVMFIALYRWSRYAPIFPDGAARAAIEEALRSSQ